MNATPEAPSTALVRILLVGDDQADQLLIADLLDGIAGTRFLIDRARTRADGLDRLEQDRFDVCLLDLHLPDGDGLDLLASAQARGLTLPMVVLTGPASVERDRRAMALGAAAFLDRSLLDPTTLERTLRYAVHQRKIVTGLARDALRDGATGLIGSALYRDRLERALAFARRRDREVAVMMIDLAFDPGEEPSPRLTDLALAEAGRRLAGDLRETDTVARLADRRLALLIEGMTSLDHAATVARKTLRNLRSPLDLDARTILVQPSVGIAVYPREGGEPEALMRQADAALRRALADGGGCCRFASERVDYEAREGMVLERAFAAAFERRDLALRFHPEIHLTGRAAGLAGEIFWRHPDRGWLPLEKDLAHTDDASLIKGIADWTLAAAAEQLKAWERDGPGCPRLSLPLPFRHRLALKLIERAVAEQVAARNVDPARIELDLQEDLVLGDARRGLADLLDLKTTGVRLALDGFGRGRATIQDLRSDVLNGLKLAPDLYRHLSDDARSETFLRALINLGHDLDLAVTAKGAADQRQFTLLKRLGCDAVQLSAAFPPMTAAAAAIWLRSTDTIGSVDDRQARPSEILVPAVRPRERPRAKTRPGLPRDGSPGIS